MRTTLFSLRHLINPLRNTQSRKGLLGHAIKSEKFQREKIEKSTGINCENIRGYRINQRFKYMEIKPQPFKEFYGFDYTEDFDGLQLFANKKVFVNFKNVCGSGGSQNRTMREVYHFIEAQCKTISNFNNGSVLLYDDENSMTPMTDVYFANILDGDEIEKNFNKYQYLFVHYPIYAQDRIFVGTSDEYEKWFINNIRHHETK
jgi:hypothetical protein